MLNQKVALFVCIFWFALVLSIILAANAGNLGWAYQLAAIIPWFDKLGHAFLFGMLGLTAGYALPGKAAFIARWHLPAGTCVVLAFAVVEEFSQLLLSHRNFDLLDLLINVIAIAATGMLLRFAQAYKSQSA